MSNREVSEAKLSEVKDRKNENLRERCKAKL
jgi:hypothetical protein